MKGFWGGLVCCMMRHAVLRSLHYSSVGLQLFIVWFTFCSFSWFTCSMCYVLCFYVALIAVCFIVLPSRRNKDKESIYSNVCRPYSRYSLSCWRPPGAKLFTLPNSLFRFHPLPFFCRILKALLRRVASVNIIYHFDAVIAW